MQSLLVYESAFYIGLFCSYFTVHNYPKIPPIQWVLVMVFSIYYEIVVEN